jgi:serine phosphatase RsbU (regulator of sigma subunit)
MRVSRATFLWIGALVLFVAAFLGTSRLVRDRVATTFDTDQRVRETRTLLFRMLRFQLDEETGVRGFIATHDERFLDPYKQASATLPPIFPQLKNNLRDLGLTDAVLAAADAKSTNAEWLQKIARPSLAHPDGAIPLQRSGKILVDRFRADALSVGSALDDRSDALTKDFQSAMRRFDLLVVSAAALLFAIGLLFVALQTRAQNRFLRERELNEEARQRETGLRAAFVAEKQVSETLQKAFSQRVLPALPSMSFSATYVPAAEEAKVGGDWYDAFEIGQRRILFIIGDIAGHGLEAAVIMSRVRSEVLSAAVLDSNPSSILQRINERMVLPGTRAPLVTIVVGIADARNYTFAYAAAGHPPPILVEPGRAPRPLAFGGMPLGVSSKAAYRTQAIQSIPGAMLVLYTDGVVEHSRNILEGERELLESISALRPGEDPATAVYNSIFSNKVAGDDVAILTIGFSDGNDAGMTVSTEDGKAALLGRFEGSRAAPPTTIMRKAS